MDGMTGPRCASRGRRGGRNEPDTIDEELHRKRLAQILRYIANMHQPASSNSGSSAAGSGASASERSHSFVRSVADSDVYAGSSLGSNRQQRRRRRRISDFYQLESTFKDDAWEGNNRHCGVLFTMNNFRKLLAMEAEAEALPSRASLFEKTPFSFYAAPASCPSGPAGGRHGGNGQSIKGKYWSNLKRTNTGAAATESLNGDNGALAEGGYWLRITRPPATQRPLSRPRLSSNPAAERYVRELLSSNCDKGHRAATVEDLLTIDGIERLAAGIPPSMPRSDRRQIKSFLRQYELYLRKKAYRDDLQLLYNRLFEWQQSGTDADELVFGIGHARMELGDGSLVNGPLLEVLVEVELARDGALMVRPREHTGVALNRQVVSSSARGGGTATAGCSGTTISQLHRDVAELEPSQLSPGQPSTYVPLLRRIAVELSPGGIFRASSSSAIDSQKDGEWTNEGGEDDESRLVVSEAWCLYSRPGPTSAWARDATAFADQLMLSTTTTSKTVAGSDSGAGTLSVPMATWSITHGPGVLEGVVRRGERSSGGARLDAGGSISQWLLGAIISSRRGPAANDKGSEEGEGSEAKPSSAKRPLFPPPTSDAQNRIAELLLDKNYPAVVCEGPPGTGKTHSIANVVCAYLCRGKRVLVTSKNAPALSVLRNRLPDSVRELCVDVSMSELSGMRQLQKTVERLANRVACVHPEMEGRKCELLRRNIDELEEQLKDIDGKISRQSERIRELLMRPDGEKLVELATWLIKDSPWVIKSLSWDDGDLASLQSEVAALDVDGNDPMWDVSGFARPPAGALISYCSARAGSALSAVSVLARKAVASVPLLGSASGLDLRNLSVVDDAKQLRLLDSEPSTKNEWRIVVKALQHAQALHSFERDVWRPYVRREGWPEIDFLDRKKVHKLNEVLARVVELKGLIARLDAKEEMGKVAECRALDEARIKMCSQIQSLAEELVDAAVVKELGSGFSPDAQSALIKFSQLTGRKLSRSQVSKMSQRQRRRRQEYLDAFNRCSRFIPCWILTTAQICIYLPPELCLFDLVIIDEASQSDITVLSTMMRARQWLIVGDGKQVSPTECFVSEGQIDSLRAALPSSPLESSLLPGQSFFDMCAQAYPRGRVVLREHFRCAEEIISFSNHHFYDDRLTMLRLPTRSERLEPAIVDVKLDRGVKVGKVNEAEADKIVELIEEAISDPNIGSKSRSIGVISLMGDEQTRIIRKKLLDVTGPEKYARHNILVGDPPTFQGAERDIVYLSMVCSKGKVPTQNQQHHFQRVNVACSRARDRCVLVRSIDVADVPSFDDIKVPIIEFFQRASESVASAGEINGEEEPSASACIPQQRGRRREGTELLKYLLTKHGFSIRPMGKVWKNAICVEWSDDRAAILVDGEGPSYDWELSFSQQKAIERVGWKCLRLDALSLFVDFNSTLASVMKFLSDSGVDRPKMDIDDAIVEEEEAKDDSQDVAPEAADDNVAALNGENEEAAGAVVAAAAAAADIIVVSSDSDSVVEAGSLRPQPATISSAATGSHDEFDASQYGDVVDLGFLRDNNEEDRKAAARWGAAHRGSDSSSNTYQGDLSDNDADDLTHISKNENRHRKKRRKYKRLDKYSRDGRWYPDRSAAAEESDGEDNMDGMDNEKVG